MRLLIKNIKALIATYPQETATIVGKDMAQLPLLEDAWLAVEDEIIVDFGEMKDWPGISDWSQLTIVDAEEGFVLPTWCDSHTHTVFAKSRALEFEDKIRGMSYEEIAARGGGILNSAAAMAEMSEEQLFRDAQSRIARMIKNGTGALEIKTGYGLDVENELKMLRVIQRLKSESPIPIKVTLLMGHALPTDYKGQMDAYMQHLENELLPQALEIGFDFIDIFCERDYFQVCHLEQILAMSKRHDKPAKIHVNQFYSIGGIQAAIAGQALSIDHVEVLSDQDLTDLEKNPIIVTGLPACSLFTKIPYTPARALMDRNIPVALATDFNPGSAPNGNMNLVNSLACIQMKMTPEEVVNASTQNGAAAMNLHHEVGSISIGKKANFILTEPLEHLSELFYYFGESRIKGVYINGQKYEA